MLALCLMVLGNLHRDHGGRQQALTFYEQAMQYAHDLNDSSPAGKNELANVLTNHGICLLPGGGEAELTKAIACFEKAIALRAALPLEHEPRYRWGLAAGYMNQGDALNRLHGKSGEAIAAYEQAISHLEKMPPDWEQDLVQRLGLAWSNRGLASAHPDEALRCFARCIEVIGAPRTLRQTLVLHNALLHRATLRLAKLEDPTQAAADARGVLESLKAEELLYPAMAELTLQARHLLCRSLCVWIDGPKKGSDISEDWIAETTDAVEEALALERHWSQRGLLAFRPLAAELFSLGARVYRVCQPHFLAEFLCDSMDPKATPGAPFNDVRFQGIAARELKLGLDDSVNRSAASVLEPERHAKEIAILQQLKEVDLRLAELQRGLD